jgi:hypothetical protein
MDVVRQELGDRLQLIPRLRQQVLCPGLAKGCQERPLVVAGPLLV